MIKEKKTIQQKKYAISTIKECIALLPDDEKSISDFCSCLKKFIILHKDTGRLLGVKPESMTDGVIHWTDDEENIIKDVKITIK